MGIVDKATQLNIKDRLNKELEANHYCMFVGVGAFHPFGDKANHYGKVKQERVGKLCQIAMR